MNPSPFLKKKKKKNHSNKSFSRSESGSGSFGSLFDQVIDEVPYMRKTYYSGINMYDIDRCTALGVQVFFNFAIVIVVLDFVLNKNIGNLLPVFNYQCWIVA